MGSSLHTHIGPYIIVKGTKTITVDKTVNTCTNKQCQTHKANQPYFEVQKFCAECGNPVSEKKYKEHKELDACDLYFKADEHVDKLVHTDGKKDIHVFTSNHRSPFEFGKRAEPDFQGLDLRGFNPEEEIQWFRDYYKDVLDMFRSELGENCVEFKWGVVTWWW